MPHKPETRPASHLSKRELLGRLRQAEAKLERFLKSRRTKDAERVSGQITRLSLLLSQAQ